MLKKDVRIPATTAQNKKRFLSNVGRIEKVVESSSEYMLNELLFRCLASRAIIDSSTVKNAVCSAASAKGRVASIVVYAETLRGDCVCLEIDGPELRCV
jgi:hypothetical protein